MKIKFLIPVLFMLLSTFTALEAQTKKEVNSKQASVLLQKDSKLIVLDVRTPEEFKEGHIKGAINIDIRQEDAFSKIDKLNRTAKYLVYCRTNHRSGMAVDHMMQSGFKNVYQMMDGFPGWAANKLAVQK
jgi:rhodanese-related sulfurtransferase